MDAQPLKSDLPDNRILPAIILRDYIKAPYAQWMKEGKKTIETRDRMFKALRGPIVICCSNESFCSPNAGRAVCIVNFYEATDMGPEHELLACCKSEPGRIAYLTNNRRLFSYDFLFAPQRVSGAFQSVFKIRIPDRIRVFDVTS